MKEMERLVDAARRFEGYNEGLKSEFKNAALAFLKKLEKMSGIPKHPKAKKAVSWNEGGIAVSGDATLCLDGWYVCVSVSSLGSFIYWRTNDKDDQYGTGMKHHNRFGKLEDCWADIAKLAHVIS